MDIFDNTENVMLLFLSLSLCLLTLNIFHLVAHCFICFFSSSFLSLSTICVLFSLFFSLSVHHPYPLHPLLCCSVFGLSSFPFLPLLSFPLLTPPPTTPPAGCGDRKLVDCPQLLDVDDMVKMREPDWKCVYTYLQEFYRGLVTKGLVKTKNSS